MDPKSVFDEGVVPGAPRHTQCIIDALPNPCLIVDRDACVRSANRVFRDMFGWPHDKVDRRMFDTLGLWRPTDLHGLLLSVGDDDAVMFDLQVIVDIPSQFTGYTTAYARRIPPGCDENEYAMVTIRRPGAEALQRAADEMSRVHAREHRIATQLQEALRPPIPQAVPGLALKEYYRACLSEANVGGDFLDVYALRENVYALAVGDVSGKGLAAATQVSAVRNMLRYALYRGRTLHGAVDQLNAMLTEQRLLTGFVSIFVALYNAQKRTLTYVSCGHEPGLLRRANDGSIVQMPAHGPPLGILENARYQEEVVVLKPGDSLILFTDGLSEAGLDRRMMLGTDGMTDILRTAPLSHNVDLLVAHIVARAESFAGAAFRDDVCLLAGIVHEDR